MSMVYRYAFINIGATGASDSSDGCFWQREPESICPTFLTITWETPGDQRITKKYQVVPDHNAWAGKLLEQPLNTRGWVFQERILSPRIVHFAKEQVFWECRESIACETYPLGLPASLRQNTAVDIKTLDLGDQPRDDKWSSKYVFGRPETSEKILRRLWGKLTRMLKPTIVQEVSLNASLNPPSVYKDWDAVVELYSQGSLTFAADKLVALSGLASTVLENGRTVVDDGYLAGLWHSSLPGHLLWITQENLKAQRLRETVDKYIAPSWSWASIDGRISFRLCQRNYNFKEYAATLEAAEVELESSLRFGQVRSGSIRLSGPLASVSIDAAKEVITQISPCAVGQQHYDPVSVEPEWREEETEREVYFDCLRDSETCPVWYDERFDPPPLTFLPIVSTTKSAVDNREFVCGLMLVPPSGLGDVGSGRRNVAEVDRYYDRWGVFFTTRPQLCRIFKNLPRQTVTIL